MSCVSPGFPNGYLKPFSEPGEFDGIDLSLSQHRFSTCSHPKARCARSQGIFGTTIHYQTDEKQYRIYWCADPIHDPSGKSWPAAEKILHLVRFDELEAECREKTGKDCPLTLGPWQEYDAAKGHPRILKP